MAQFIKRRNPVFALEMIQTVFVLMALSVVAQEVAIQYSPWR